MCSGGNGPWSTACVRAAAASVPLSVTRSKAAASTRKCGSVGKRGSRAEQVGCQRCSATVVARARVGVAAGGVNAAADVGIAAVTRWLGSLRAVWAKRAAAVL